MLLSLDKTGFPLAVVAEAELEVQLLPVTKLQIEQFLLESDRYDGTWYRRLAALNPPLDAERLTAERYAGLFATGLLPHEAADFARWLGEGFDLPTLAEWRIIYRVLGRQVFPGLELLHEWAARPIGPLLDRLCELRHVRTLRDLSFMRGGIVEWVGREEEWVGVGAPSPHFYPNLWHPLYDHIRPRDPQERLAYFGFRLVRRGQWDVSNKPGGVFIF